MPHLENILIALVGLVLGTLALKFYRRRGLSPAMTIVFALVIGLAVGAVLMNQ